MFFPENTSGTGWGRLLQTAANTCNFSTMAYNPSRGVWKQRAHACRFPGIVPAWGRQTVGL